MILIKQSDEVFNSLVVLNQRTNYRSKYFTLSAQFYLFLPAILTPTLAEGPIHKPADMPNFKFPGSTVLSPFIRAVSYLPTGSSVFVQGPL